MSLRFVDNVTPLNAANLNALVDMAQIGANTTTHFVFSGTRYHPPAGTSGVLLIYPRDNSTITLTFGNAGTFSCHFVVLSYNRMTRTMAGVVVNGNGLNHILHESSDNPFISSNEQAFNVFLMRPTSGGY